MYIYIYICIYILIQTIDKMTLSSIEICGCIINPFYACIY